MDTIATSRTFTDRPLQERRAWPRTPRRIRVLVLPEDSAVDEPYAGWITDSSKGGLRLAVERIPLGVGTLIRLRHPGSPSACPWMLVRVKHRLLQQEVWHLGCEFVRSGAGQTKKAHRC